MADCGVGRSCPSLFLLKNVLNLMALALWKGVLCSITNKQLCSESISGVWIGSTEAQRGAHRSECQGSCLLVCGCWTSYNFLIGEDSFTHLRMTVRQVLCQWIVSAAWPLLVRWVCQVLDSVFWSQWRGTVMSNEKLRSLFIDRRTLP